jgi:hypothetical protein
MDLDAQAAEGINVDCADEARTDDSRADIAQRGSTHKTSID